MEDSGYVQTEVKRLGLVLFYASLVVLEKVQEN